MGGARKLACLICKLCSVLGTVSNVAIQHPQRLQIVSKVVLDNYRLLKHSRLVKRKHLSADVFDAKSLKSVVIHFLFQS